jgi:hypothetical protein
MSESNVLTTQERTTEAKKAKFIESFLKCGFNISKACDMAGIHRRTYYDWCEKDPGFLDNVRDSQERLVDNVEDALMDKIADGDTTSIIFFLKTKGKHRGYVEKQQTEHSGNVGVTFHIDLGE